MEEENEEVDVIEFFQSKGTKLDSLKKEFLDITTSLELTVANNIGKEREYESLQQELKSLREQLTYTKRNIDEINSQQEVLKQTIEHINHKKESLYQKESSDRDEIQSFSSYFTELKDNLSIGYDWTPEQLEQRSILEKERDFIQSKLENTLNMLNAVRSDIERTYDAIQQKEEELLSNDQKLQSIEQHRNDIKKKISSLKNKKNSIDKKILEARSLVLYHEEELTKRSNSYKDEENALKQLDQSILRSKTKMELYLSQYEVLYRNLTEITSELEKQKAINKKIKQENDEKLKYCEEKTIEIKSISKELQKVNQLREIALTKTNEIDNEKKEIEININNINRTITTIRDIEINNIRKELDSLDKQIIQLKSELDVIRKKHTGSEKVSKSLIDLIQLNKNGKINLSLEKKVLEEEAELQKAQIRNLLTEKERYEHDGEIANQQYYTALEELKLQELQIQELNKKVNDDQMKLKQKQSMYESVRSDRNLYSKQLLDSQEEINLLKRNFRSMNHHIDQMKEEISVRDHSIVKEHFLHHSVDKERELLKNELTKIRKQVQSSELIVENQRVEIMKLQRIIEEADQERQRQKNELGAILSERNLLTGQLVKRNYELGELYEKIKSERSNLHIGERNFNKFLEQLSVWQKELIDVVQSHNETIQGLSKLDVYKNRVIQLERDILKEQTKYRALQDELETPMNVHRWRILESSDPKRFEKIVQIHTLQKHLVQMSDKVVQDDLLIQEKEKIYVELKNVIARQPGPEVEEQILLYQQTLKDKTKQFAAMEHELEMYIEQVHRFKEEITDIDQKTMKINKKWMKTRRSKELGTTRRD